jgi:hypothetical protein
MALSVIVDPGMAGALLSGRKTQMRVPADSATAQAEPGDVLRVREACIAAREKAGQEYATALNRADYVIFPDGWRQMRDGSGWQGARKADGEHQWVPAIIAPDWACRMGLLVEGRRAEPLQQIRRRDIRAEGALPLLGGPLWRWPKPIPGLHLGARRAFARYWDLNHPAPGARWEDDPEVIVLDVRLIAGPMG